MSKILWSILLTSPMALMASATVTMAQEVQTQTEPAQRTLLEQLEQYSREGNSRSLGQVNSVDQLRDVDRGHWAYQALKSLIDKYGCMRGFPDRTFRGNQGVTRYEFAATLNECLQRIEGFITPSSPGDERGISLGDERQIWRLVNEFEAELAILSARVDDIEGRVDFLEDHQFSTTTKLEGEVVFAISDAFGESTQGDDTTVFQDRVRLNFVSSFTGKDALYTRLGAGNFDGFSTTDQGVFVHDFGNLNNIEIDWLAYYFPIGDKLLVYLPAAYPLWQDIAPTVSPYLDGFTGANNAITSFGESSPIYKIGLASGGGIAANYEISDEVTLTGGYFGGNSFNPEPGQGLFNGKYSALGQITWTPNDKFQIAATYVNAYFNTDSDSIFDLGVGTDNARRPFEDGSGSAITNSYGAEIAYKFSDKLAVNGFFGYTDAQQTSGGNGSAEIWYYGLGLAFPDLGKEGNLAGIIVGAEPYVGDCEGTGCVSGAADSTAIHIEGFYRYAVNDHISVTPGIVWIAAPFGVGESSNDSVVIGTIRTTFSF